MSSWKRRACNSENVCPTPEKKSVDRRDSHCQGLLSIFVSTCTIITFVQFLSLFHPLILFLGKTKSVSLQCKIDTEQAGKYSLLSSLLVPLADYVTRDRGERLYSQATSEDRYLFYDDGDFQTYRLLISMALLEIYLFLFLSWMRTLQLLLLTQRSSTSRQASRLKSPRFFIASFLVIVLKLLGQVWWHSKVPNCPFPR